MVSAIVSLRFFRGKVVAKDSQLLFHFSLRGTFERSVLQGTVAPGVPWAARQARKPGSRQERR